MSDGGSDQVSGAPARVRAEKSGVAASSGIGIGPAYVVDRRHVHVPRARIERELVDDEIKRFHDALRATRQQIEGIKGRLPHGEHRQILKAQQMMLRDPDMIARTETLIREELRGAEWSVATVADEIHAMLDQADDAYFRERRTDIMFLSERVIQALLGDHWQEITPPAGSVVVAHDLSPADTAQFSRFKVAGIVTEEGGQTSHTAIIARALQIPAVVGVLEATQRIQDGQWLRVDGNQGFVELLKEG